MSYMAIKHLHLAAVALGILLLLLRGFWLSTGSGMLAKKWPLIVTHLNYGVLFLAGLALAFSLSGRLGDHPWLIAKVVGFVVLVILGARILPRMKTTGAKLAVWAIAVLLFIYIVAVALTKQPLPWAG
ncbi:MAG: SirB2 family protein [Burkholderiales bacterium]|nr:SirB2 family protein [Burkholderiales bacterium]